MSRKKYSNIPEIQTGVVTLIAGAGSVANIFFDGSSRVVLMRQAAVAPAGPPVPNLATGLFTLGNGNGGFTLTSNDGADVGVIAWAVVTVSGNPAQV